MGQAFIIAQSPNFLRSLKLDYTKFFSVKGNTISYIASVIMYFLDKDFDYDDRSQEGKDKGWPDFKHFLEQFSQATPGYDALGLESLSTKQFMQVYQSLIEGYNYLKNASLEKREEWIAENTIYGHVENLWDTTTWAGTYENHKGETRHNNIKNVLEDVLDMMRLDERFDPDQIN